MKIFLTAIFLLSFPALLLSAGKDAAVPVKAEKAGEVSENNSILASVNGRVITLMDVLPLTYAREQHARSVYSGERLLKMISDYRKAAVDDLIDNLLIQSEFAKYNFVLSNQDIEREIDEAAVRSGCQSRKQLEARLKKDGSSISEFRLSIRKNMMVQLMLFRQLKIADPISPKELYEYFAANEAAMAVPARVSLAMLKLDSSKPDFESEVKRIGEILKADPGKFIELVAANSPALAGDFGEIDCKLLRPEFAAAFKEFIPGTIAGPVKVYDGVVWLKVISYTPAKKVAFHEVEAQLKLELERKHREKVIREYAEKLRRNALIEYYF